MGIGNRESGIGNRELVIGHWASGIGQTGNWELIIAPMITDNGQLTTDN
ncbi:hypothetical protein [Microcoleus sp. CAWBG58]|nr:hypothetical protein [Microcoleus sp. CAWBG58]